MQPLAGHTPRPRSLPPLSTSLDDSDMLPPFSEPTPEPTLEPPTKRPRLTDAMKPSFFDRSAMDTAWAAQKNQAFGKDNLDQAYTTEASFFHVLLPVMKSRFLSTRSTRVLCLSHPPIKTLWTEYQRVHALDWTPLCNPNPDWQTQQRIDDHRVDLRMAMLFHYNLDLAAVHRRIGGNHVGAHRDVAKIIKRLKHLLEPELLEELRRVLVNGCPAKFNEEGTRQEFEAMWRYGNHQSVNQNLEKVMATMNK